MPPSRKLEMPAFKGLEVVPKVAVKRGRGSEGANPGDFHQPGCEVTYLPIGSAAERCSAFESGKLTASKAALGCHQSMYW